MSVDKFQRTCNRAIAWLNAHGGDAALTRKSETSRAHPSSQDQRTLVLAAGKTLNIPMEVWRHLETAGIVKFYDNDRRLRLTNQSRAELATRSRLHGPLTPDKNVFSADEPPRQWPDAEDQFEKKANSISASGERTRQLHHSFHESPLDLKLSPDEQALRALKTPVR